GSDRSLLVRDDAAPVSLPPSTQGHRIRFSRCRCCDGAQNRTPASSRTRAPESQGEECLAGDGQVLGRLATVLLRLDLVGDLLTFLQRLHASTLHRADMDEDVLAAGLRLDKAEAFGGVEPFDGACRHRSLRSSLTGLAARTRAASPTIRGSEGGLSERRVTT